MQRCAAGLAALVLAGGLSACSSDSGTEQSAESSPTADVCASADALRSSLSALGEVQVVQEGSAALADAWTSVEDAWNQMAADARDEYSDQVDGVQADVDAVQSALDAAQATPSAQTLRDAATAVGVFLQDAGALTEDVTSTC